MSETKLLLCGGIASEADPNDTETAVPHCPLVMGQALFELSVRPRAAVQGKLIDIATVYRFHAPEPRPQFHELVWKFALTTSRHQPFGGLEEQDFRWTAQTLAQLLFDHHAVCGHSTPKADLSLVVQ